MIVDDRILIIGSANLTDRSLVGSQDSEIAVRIEDGLHQTIQLGGKTWQAGCLPHNLRLLLMKQHTGYSLSSNNSGATQACKFKFNYYFILFLFIFIDFHFFCL